MPKERFNKSSTGHGSYLIYVKQFYNYSNCVNKNLSQANLGKMPSIKELKKNPKGYKYYLEQLNYDPLKPKRKVYESTYFENIKKNKLYNLYNVYKKENNKIYILHICSKSENKRDKELAIKMKEFFNSNPWLFIENNNQTEFNIWSYKNITNILLNEGIECDKINRENLKLIIMNCLYKNDKLNNIEKVILHFDLDKFINIMINKQNKYY